jgi:cation diffusion facilitator family transporter
MSSACAPQRCRRCAARVAVRVIVINAVLGVFKLATGVFARSAAITVDGIQSLACALVGGFVAAGMRVSRRPADRRYPYGYGKAEYLVSLLSYSALFGLGVFMFVSAGLLLLAGRSEPPMALALPVALISVVANYLMFAACRCAGEATGSAGLRANAGQNYADMLSSCSVALSVALCQLGPAFYFFDALAAVAAAVMIMVDAAACWRADLRVVLDHPLQRRLLRRVRREAAGTDGVQQIHFVRGRRTGNGLSIQLGLCVPPGATVAEAQRIGARVRGNIMRKLGRVRDVDVFSYAGASLLSA